MQSVRNECVTVTAVSEQFKWFKRHVWNMGGGKCDFSSRDQALLAAKFFYDCTREPKVKKKKKKKQYIRSWLRIMSEQLWDPAHSASHWDVLNLTCRCVCACMHVCGWQECAGCCNWEIRSQQKARVPTDTQRGDETEKDNPQSNSFISSSCICQVCSHWPTTSSWAPFEVVKYPWWHFGHFYHYPSRKCMSIT